MSVSKAQAMHQAAKPNRAVRAVSWSIAFLYTIALPSIVLAFVYNFDNFSGFTIFFTTIVLTVLLGVHAILFTSNLLIGRFLRAFAVFCGLATGCLIIWQAPTVANWKGDAQFRRDRPEFDEMVRLERTRNPTAEPIRMVVAYADRSLFVTSNSFHFVIYDETDEAIRYPEKVHGYWNYPKSETGVIDVSGRKDVQHLSGHYYSVWTAD